MTAGKDHVKENPTPQDGTALVMFCNRWALLRLLAAPVDLPVESFGSGAFLVFGFAPISLTFLPIVLVLYQW